MAQQAIFGPFFATMFLTLLVWRNRKSCVRVLAPDNELWETEAANAALPLWFRV